LRNKIRGLKLTGRRIKFWIPAHCVIQINKKADSGAKDAVSNGKDSQFLVSSSDMNAYWKGCLQEEFHAFCLQTDREKGISYFNKYCSKSANPCFEAMRINRLVMVMISRLRSGHTGLKQNLSKKGNSAISSL
jgi:hypothetical protein